MAQTEERLEPQVNTEPTPLLVRSFNKDEIEQIVGEYLAAHPAKQEPRGIDLDNLPSDLIQIVDDGGDIVEGKLPYSSASDLSDEEMAILKKNLLKAIKDGVIKFANTYLFVSYVEDGESSTVVCFGCTTSHTTTGYHFELDLVYTSNNYGVVIDEI